MSKKATLKGMCVAVAALLLAAACDMLRVEPFRIVSWSPGRGYAGEGDTAPIEVTFSEVPDQASAENAFSLTGNGAVVVGDFSWRGPSLSFSPNGLLQPNSDYRLSISSDARTAGGLSLEFPFEAEFSTKPETVRPRVLSTIPAYGGILPAVTDPISLSFSEPVDAVAYPEVVSLSPGIKGMWSFDESGTVATFVPVEPWELGTEYEVKVSADATDRSGNSMGEAVSFRFSVGDDRVVPELLALEAIDESGAVVSTLLPDGEQDGVVTENRGWERTWMLRARFSESVDLGTVDANVEGENGASPRRITSGEASDVIEFSLTSLPEWGGAFLIRFCRDIRDASGNRLSSPVAYRFIADGPRSKPPRFVGVRFPLAPGAAPPLDKELAVFSVARPYDTIAIASDIDRFPIGIPTELAFECYFEVARGAALDRLSLMECFRAYATNGALDFSASEISLGGLGYAPPYEAWSGLAVVRVEAALVNRVASGVFTIQFAPGLEDTSGNINESAQRLAMLK